MHALIYFQFSLGSVGVLCKFPMLRFSKGYSSRSIYSILTKLYGKYDSQGEYRLFLFWWSAKFKKMLCHWKFQNATPPTVFIQSAPNFMRTPPTAVGEVLMKGPHVGEAVSFPGNLPSFEIFVAVWNWVNGKVLKCWIPWKYIADHRAKHIRFETHGSGNCLCVGYFSYEIWVQLGVIPCTLQNFLR